MGGFNGAVLLFKGDEVDPQDKYLCALTEASYRAFIVPVLQFNFVNQVSSLRVETRTLIIILYIPNID